MISIITTYYNYPQYISELAESVVNQHCPFDTWEWIIIDDASDESPLPLLEKYRQHDILGKNEIRYKRLVTNSGYSVAKNVGLRMAQGNLIVMIDADDVLTKDSIYTRSQKLLKSDKLWLHADALNYNVHGGIEKTYINWIKRWRDEYKLQGIDLTKTYFHRLVHSQTVMMRRRFYETLGLYDETLRFSSDNEMWRRAIRFGILPEYFCHPVCIYRAHNDRMSRSEYKKKRILETKEYIKDIVETRFKEGINHHNTQIY